MTTSVPLQRRLMGLAIAMTTVVTLSGAAAYAAPPTTPADR